MLLLPKPLLRDSCGIIRSIGYDQFLTVLMKDRHGMYTIDFTPRALEDLRWFKKHEQKVILDGINRQLRNAPTVATRNRKPLRPNSTAAWELRIEQFRIFYDVDEQVRIVEIQRVGEKRGSAFFFRGRQEDL